MGLNGQKESGMKTISSNCIDNIDEAPRSGLKEAKARIEVLEARLAEGEASIHDGVAHSGMCTCE